MLNQNVLKTWRTQGRAWPLLRTGALHRCASQARASVLCPRKSAGRWSCSSQICGPGSPIWLICPGLSTLCLPISRLWPCQVRTLQPFSWGLQPAGHFEIVYMPGRPQHFLPPQSSRGSSRDGEVVKVGVTSVDYVDSFTISGSCRVLINADLQGCTAFAKFSEMGQCFKLQLLLPPHPEFSLCPQGCPQTHQPPLWVEVLHSGNTRTYFWLF